ncbi:MAG: L,D-transpeptidase family protein [Chloroflexota bacterium]
MDQGNAALLRQAQAAIRQGEKHQARQLLQEALQRDRDNYVAWLLMASVTNDPRTSLGYVKQAAQLNPSAATVQKALVWAENRVQTAAAAADTAVSQSPPPAEKRRWWLWGGVALTLLLVVLAIFSALYWPGRNAQAAVEMASVVTLSTMTPAAELASGALPADVAEVGGEETDVATPTIAPSFTPTPAPHIVAKNIGQSKDNDDHQPRPTWTLTPSPTPTPTPTNTPMPTFVAPQSGPVSRPFGVGANERWVDVNLTTQSLVAYEGDTAVLSTFISSGTWQHPTVTGQFRIYLTYQSQTMDGRRLGYDYYLENVPYVMYFYEDYALHGTFWHNNFGTPMSHGCVNMKTSEAGWLYEWVSIGTLVNVHY